MIVVIAIVCLAMGVLYAGQLISVADFGRAQRLGLQEGADTADPLWHRLELATAWWDLATLWTLPVAGVLMLLDHSWWPYLALIGGGVYVDTGGREGAKLLAVRREGVRAGAPHEQRKLFGAYLVMIAVGLAAITAGLLDLT